MNKMGRGSFKFGSISTKTPADTIGLRNLYDEERI
jgi:hypothetical protein